MTSAQLIAVVKREIMSLSSEFTTQNYNDAVSDAERDCGWSLPQTDNFKVKWLKERTKRHLFWMYLIGSLGLNFQYEQVHLEHQFKQYHTLVKDIDESFEEAKNEDPAAFAGVSVSHLFGTKIDAGFQYDDVGRETTFDDDENEIIFNPTESD